jgi:hypothetical protein
MNNKLFLQKLFVGFVQNFQSFRWHTSSNYSDITAKELGHFSQIGELLGFCVRREMNWNYPRDLCWVEGSLNNATPYLYMERESKDNRMKHTIEKMLSPENSAGIPILVVSFGHLTPESYAQASTMLKKGLEGEQIALLYAWVAEKEESSSYEIVARIITNNSIVESKAIPYVSAKTNFWCMHFETGVGEWH